MQLHELDWRPWQSAPNLWERAVVNDEPVFRGRGMYEGQYVMRRGTLDDALTAQCILHQLTSKGNTPA
jgi:hypothetical protein